MTFVYLDSLFSSRIDFCMPQGDATGSQDNEWGMKENWHHLVASERSLDQASLYTDGYKHRTSTKTLLVSQLSLAMLAIAETSMKDGNDLPGRYVAEGLRAISIWL